MWALVLRATGKRVALDVVRMCGAVHLFPLSWPRSYLAVLECDLRKLLVEFPCVPKYRNLCRIISRFDMSLRRRTGSGQNRYATKTS